VQPVPDAFMIEIQSSSFLKRAPEWLSSAWVPPQKRTWSSAWALQKPRVCYRRRQEASFG